MSEFHKTRMGQQFYERTVPDLVNAVKRIADQAEGKRDPRIKELIDHAGYLADAVDTLMETPIELGSQETLDAFELLRGQAAAVRRILGLIGC